MQSAYTIASPIQAACGSRGICYSHRTCQPRPTVVPPVGSEPARTMVPNSSAFMDKNQHRPVEKGTPPRIRVCRAEVQVTATEPRGRSKPACAVSVACVPNVAMRQSGKVSKTVNSSARRSFRDISPATSQIGCSAFNPVIATRDIGGTSTEVIMPQFERPAAILLVSVASFSVLFLTLAIVMPN